MLPSLSVGSLISPRRLDSPRYLLRSIFFRSTADCPVCGDSIIPDSDLILQIPQIRNARFIFHALLSLSVGSLISPRRLDSPRYLPLEKSSSVQYAHCPVCGDSIIPDADFILRSQIRIARFIFMFPSLSVGSLISPRRLDSPRASLRSIFFRSTADCPVCGNLIIPDL